MITLQAIQKLGDMIEEVELEGNTELSTQLWEIYEHSYELLVAVE